MTKIALQLTAIALILILVQVIVLNNVCLFGVAVPFAFIYVMFRLPVTLSKEWLFTIGFALGIVIDIFSDTQGMNALACTLTMVLRRPVLRLYFQRDDEMANPCPGIASLGIATYAKYALTLSLLYCILFFLIEAFALFDIQRMILSIISSTILTTLLLIGIDSLTLRRREKRL